MLDSLAPARRRFVLVLAGLVGAVVLVVAGLAVVRATDDVEPVSQDAVGPVLLVSGYGGSTTALEELEDAVDEVGRDAVVVPVVGDGTGDLDAQAEALGAYVDDVLADGAPSVDVVGYSAGGVVARAWVRDHGGAEQARRVVTLGSPHHGTQTAQLAIDAAGTCPEACLQLAPDSDFLRALNAGDETPDGPAWTSIWTESDQVVTPPDSARLEGAVDLTVQELCSAARPGHGDLPGDRAAQALVIGALQSPDPTEPEFAVSC